jgi:hypothetical protein
MHLSVVVAAAALKVRPKVFQLAAVVVEQEHQVGAQVLKVVVVLEVRLRLAAEVAERLEGSLQTVLEVVGLMVLGLMVLSVEGQEQLQEDQVKLESGLQGHSG